MFDNDYERCPRCKCYSVPKSMRVYITQSLGLPRDVMGVTHITSKWKFCEVCDLKFNDGEEDE